MEYFEDIKNLGNKLFQETENTSDNFDLEKIQSIMTELNEKVVIAKYLTQNQSQINILEETDETESSENKSEILEIIEPQIASSESMIEDSLQTEKDVNSIVENKVAQEEEEEEEAPVDTSTEVNSVEMENEKQDEVETTKESVEIPDDSDAKETISQENSIVDLTSNTDEALADKFRNKEISDLSSSIGISEKFLFIHELFSGNTERYIKELNRLNDSKDLADATKKLAKLESELNWEVESKAYNQLSRLVERKYPA